MSKERGRSMQIKDRPDFPKNELCVCLKIRNKRMSKEINYIVKKEEKRQVKCWKISISLMNSSLLGCQINY